MGFLERKISRREIVLGSASVITGLALAACGKESSKKPQTGDQSSFQDEITIPTKEAVVKPTVSKIEGPSPWPECNLTDGIKSNDKECIVKYPPGTKMLSFDAVDVNGARHNSSELAGSPTILIIAYLDDCNSNQLSRLMIPVLSSEKERFPNSGLKIIYTILPDWFESKRGTPEEGFEEEKNRFIQVLQNNLNRELANVDVWFTNFSYLKQISDKDTKLGEKISFWEFDHGILPRVYFLDKSFEVVVEYVGAWEKAILDSATDSFFETI